MLLHISSKWHDFMPRTLSCATGVESAYTEPCTSVRAPWGQRANWPPGALFLSGAVLAPGLQEHKMMLKERASGMYR